MALFLGDTKSKLKSDGDPYKIDANFVKGNILLSSENNILKDCNGTYLTVKESE